MPKDTVDDDVPSTLRRSPAKARRTWKKAHDAAADSYGEGERAYRTAWSAVKHSFEKVGDHWEPKAEKGPSDPRARSGGPDASGETFGGVDFEGSTRAELYERARRLGVSGASRMRKARLARAIDREQQRETRQAREDGS
jgi:cation transport regulator ChaB